MKSKLDVLEHLKSTPIVQVACQKAGVSRATYYRWREEDPDFKKKSDIAMGEGVEMINDLCESQLLKNIRDGHPTSTFYWLNNHHPSYSQRRILLPYKQKSDIGESIAGFKRENLMITLLNLVFEGQLPISVAGSLMNSVTKHQKFKDNQEIDENLAKLKQIINAMSIEARAESKKKLSG